MTKTLLNIVILILLTFCGSKQKISDYIKLDINGDTVEVIKKYPSGHVREIVYYKDNVAFSNIGFYENGDSIRNLDVTKFINDSLLFAFVPIRMNIQSYEIVFGADSESFKDPKVQKVLTEFSGKLQDLKVSTLFRYNRILGFDGTIKGVFRCGMDTGTGIFYDIYPFKVPMLSAANSKP